VTHAPIPRKALWQMTAGAALISTTSIFVRLSNVAPTISAFYRMAFGGGLLLVGLIALGQWRRVRMVDVAWLIVPGVAFAVDLALWHRSILYIGPGLATLLGNFQVFLMAIAGYLIYRERLSPWFIGGVALAFIGLLLLVGHDWSRVDAQYQLGVVLAILTGVAYAVFMLSTRHAQRGHVLLAPAQLLCVSSLLTALVLGFTALAESDSFAIPDAQTWGALLGLALFGQVTGWVLLTRAMPQLPASLVGLLLLLQPALSFVLDVVLFARPTSGLDWLGLALSLLGIFIGSVRARPAPVGEPA
jgi:drug/metabolite transporter (DMT)-like permease